MSSMRMLLSTRALVLLLCAARATTGQLVFDESKIEPPYNLTGWGFGNAMAAADLDRDGFDDLLVWESGATVSGVGAAGRLWILRGPLLALDEVIEPAPQIGQLGYTATALGDVDGDGSTDILAGAPLTPVGVQAWVGSARLLLGPDFVREITFEHPEPHAGDQMGTTVLLADLTGDGRDDVIVGAKWADKTIAGTTYTDLGRLWVWTESELDTAHLVADRPIELPAPTLGQNAFFSVDLDSIDWDRDGILDLMAPAAYGFGASQDKLWVFGGNPLGLLAGVSPPATEGFLYGFGELGGHADVDHDGNIELVVGASGATSPSLCPDAGAVVILGGAEFESLEQLIHSPTACTSQDQKFFGGQPSLMDVDRDGWQDIVCREAGIVTAPETVWVIRGPDFRDFHLLDPAVSVTMDYGYGSGRVHGDFDGDGFPEIAVSVPEINHSGFISLYDLRTLEATPGQVSTAAGGSVALHLRAGADRAGLRYIGLLSLSGSHPGTFFGPGAWLPLNIDPLTHAGIGQLFGPWLPGFLGHLDALGTADFEFILPAGLPAALVDQTISVSAVVLGPTFDFVMASSAARIDLLP